MSATVMPTAYSQLPIVTMVAALPAVARSNGASAHRPTAPTTIDHDQAPDEPAAMPLVVGVPVWVGNWRWVAPLVRLGP